MIKKLTKKQIAKFQPYVDEWVAKGLTTTKLSLEEAVKDFTPFQSEILGKPAAPVVLLNSPTECWMAASVFHDKANLNKAMNDACKKVAEKVKQQVTGQPGGAELISGLQAPTSETKLEIPDFVYPYFDCQFWANWFAFYEYMKNELGIEYKNLDKYEIFKACQKYGMVFPLDNLCIVCQPPSVINKNKSGLHCEDGPALSYTGDNEIYALNGVIMEKKHVMTPAHQISSTDILNEKNVEVRRELIRKVGIERLLNELPHKLLDSRGNYELYSIELGEEVKDARYLKMVNPSVQVFHLEGVDPSCNTISEALKWRNNNMFEDADVLT